MFFYHFFDTFWTPFWTPFWGPKSDIFDPPGAKKVKKWSKMSKIALFPVNFPLKSTHPPHFTGGTPPLGPPKWSKMSFFDIFAR